MRAIQTIYQDNRIAQYCIYCGETKNNSKDHVPSKCLIDKPYPENLPTVACCPECNNSFSKIEEYTSCLLEMIKKLKLQNYDYKIRDKIQTSLEFNTKLQYQIKEEIKNSTFNKTRIFNFLSKQAKGHIFYHFSIFKWNETPKIEIYTVLDLTDSEIKTFLNTPEREKIGELGSRDCYDVLMVEDHDGNMIKSFYLWNTVQEEQYEYLTYLERNQIVVKIIIGGFFLCKITYVD